MTARPLAIDLYCGLGGWTDGLLLEGWDVIGFDIERHDYGMGGYPGQLVLQDVLTLHGSQFKDAQLIVASPPCQAYSYRAMPWKRAKALPPPDNSLFEACFRIQAEAIEAAGRFIPLIVENVRGAQKWVGRSAWHYGSFHLWGDVPALMPTSKSAKVAGLNWSKFGEPGYKAQGFNVTAAQRYCDGTKLPGNNSPRRWDEREVQRLGDALKVPSLSGRRTDIGNGARFTSRDCGIEGIKGSDGGRFSDNKRKGDGQPTGYLSRSGSKSNSRKAASAMIARIPLPLSRHIARVYFPKGDL